MMIPPSICPGRTYLVGLRVLDYPQIKITDTTHVDIYGLCYQTPFCQSLC